MQKEHIWLLATFALMVCASVASIAQEPPAAQQPLATLHSQSNVVLVPTLATDKSGEIVFGLSAKDFIVEDDGVEQPINLDDAPVAEPISLVVAVQVGGSAGLEFLGHNDPDDPFLSEAERKDCRLKRYACPTIMSGLGTMAEEILGANKGEIAVVTFDSEVHLFQDFTEDLAPLSKRLKFLAPGDHGAAIVDALRRSLDMLESRPKDHRRVLLLISENHDHGSHADTFEDVRQRVMLGNTLLYSLSFSPSRSEFMRDLKGQQPADAKIDITAPVRMAVHGMGKNVPASLAQLSGGEYQTFGNKGSFDFSLGRVANHVHNCYLLSFQPREPKAGPHTIRVRLRNPQRDVTLIARNTYWAVQAQR